MNYILLVEDDPITNFINERLIKKLGVGNEIKVALNGYDAILIVEKMLRDGVGYPGLILLDLNMPVMDGFEFLEKFKNFNHPEKNKVVVIVLTTSTHTKDMTKLMDSGNTDFVNKPLTEDKMKEILEKYFSNREKQ